MVPTLGLPATEIPAGLGYGGGNQALDPIHSHVPFQGAKARVFVSRSVRKRSIRSTIAHGRGRQLKTTVDHTLMRGLATAGPCSVSVASRMWLELGAA